MYCHRCGTQVADNLNFCPKCGEALAVKAATYAPVPWTPRPGIHSRSWHWIGEGWRIVQADLGTYIVLALVTLLLSSVPFLAGPVTAGFFIFCIKKSLNRRAEFADLFLGFNFFVHALVASLLISIFVFAGTLCLIIPGLVVAAMYKFTYLFIVDKRMEFWPAMQASHAVVRNDYFGFTMFLIAMALVNLLGVLCFLVGVLVTFPLTIAAITVAYREIVGFDPRTVAAM